MVGFAQEDVKSMQIEAVIVRANGTRVPLGTIARWHRNPLVRLWYRIERLYTKLLGRNT